MSTATAIELSPSQQAIADSIVHTSAFRTTLAGLAGTGKTTVARYIYEQWVGAGLDVVVMGPTGKSAVVLRRKGVPATTIHSAIYHFKGKFENLRGELELVFKDNRKGKFCDRFIVDEGSMLTEQQIRDIETRETQVLFVGDPGQLPPVKSRKTGLLDRPTHTLAEIHRQAAGSPIIQYSYLMRRGLPLTHRHPGIRHVEVRNQGPIFVASQMIDRGINRLIVHSNKQRIAINMAYRGIVDRRGVVAVGDEIMCLQNNHKLGVINGQVFKVLDVFHRGRDFTEVEIQDLDSGESDIVKVWNAQFGQEQKVDTDDDEAFSDEIILADYAYGATCHKFQGSSDRHIGIAARGFCESPATWNYTAVTRAEEELTIFC